MKSSYELAMDWLNKSAPAVKVTAAQKKELAELDSLYTAKIAERELFLKGEAEKAAEKGDFETLAQIQKQMVSERKTLGADLEEKKEKVRSKK